MGARAQRHQLSTDLLPEAHHLVDIHVVELLDGRGRVLAVPLSDAREAGPFVGTRRLTILR